MDKRSWPWKRKSSEKTSSSTDVIGTSTKDDKGKTKNVQISAESYSHLVETEAQLKILNEKFSAVQSEVTTKDTLVNQHARVAEEAIAGWEKAETEATELKSQLESVILLKVAAEDRATNLDGALKECMQQVQLVKEESEQILHDTIFAKTRQWEAIKSELDAKIADFEQELLRSSSENAALSRSLQERSNMLARISSEKSQAEAEIEVLKSGVQSCEKEISSLKYEVHVVTKELEIRNEEKNMSLRLAETANKQHLDDVKKITKLEAECQRLRGLVKKKLPGPAALAQMKMEVENLGWEYGETRTRRSPAKSSGSYLLPTHNLSFEDVHQCRKENEYLATRLLATEEETKMLKETLSKRNNELQATRTICAKTSSKLRGIEARALGVNYQDDSMKLNSRLSSEGSLSHIQSYPSLASMSEDGIDEVGSCSESSCSVAQMSELPQITENNFEKTNKADKSKHMKLMDDFLEMEKLACLSIEGNGAFTTPRRQIDVTNTETNGNAVQMDGVERQSDLRQPSQNFPGNNEPSASDTMSNGNNDLLSKLKSRIVSLLEPDGPKTHVGKVLEDVKQTVQDIHSELLRHPSEFTSEKAHRGNGSAEQEHSSGDNVDAIDKLCANKHAIAEGLKNAVLQVKDIIIPICKQAAEIQGRSSDHVLEEKVVEFSDTVSKVLSGEMTLEDFILALSHLLSENIDVRFSMLACKGSEAVGNSNDCIDKLTLLEKRIARHEPAKSRLLGECASPSSTDPVNAHVVNSPGFEPHVRSQSFYLEEYEQIKVEKHHIELEMAISSETSERAKFHLVEMEKQLAELKSQLSACQKSNSLADTQLKCMAESYNTLESRARELETEINLLRSKAEALDHELQGERSSHRDDLAKYKDLQERLERETRCSLCSLHADTDFDKAKQDREIAAAAEKLAECQETITLLGRQMKALQPSVEASSSSGNKLQINSFPSQGERHPSGYSLQSILNTVQPDQASVDNDNDDDDAGSVIQRSGDDDFTLDEVKSHFSQSDSESFQKGSKHQKQRSRSASSSSLSSMLNEKPSRGFSRFFSRHKGDH